MVLSEAWESAFRKWFPTPGMSSPDRFGSFQCKRGGRPSPHRGSLTPCLNRTISTISSRPGPGSPSYQVAQNLCEDRDAGDGRRTSGLCPQELKPVWVRQGCHKRGTGKSLSRADTNQCILTSREQRASGWQAGQRRSRAESGARETPGWGDAHVYTQTVGPSASVTYGAIPRREVPGLGRSRQAAAGRGLQGIVSSSRSDSLSALVKSREHLSGGNQGCDLEASWVG